MDNKDKGRLVFNSDLELIGMASRGVISKISGKFVADLKEVAL